MGILNFIKKGGKKSSSKKEQREEASQKASQVLQSQTSQSKEVPLEAAGANISQMLKSVDKSQLSFKEKAALKMFEKMPQKKQEELLMQAMNPQNLMNMKKEDKAKLLEQIEAGVKSGLIPKGQAEAMKSQLGLR